MQCPPPPSPRFGGLTKSLWGYGVEKYNLRLFFVFHNEISHTAFRGIYKKSNYLQNGNTEYHSTSSSSVVKHINSLLRVFDKKKDRKNIYTTPPSHLARTVRRSGTGNRGKRRQQGTGNAVV